MKHGSTMVDLYGLDIRLILRAFWMWAKVGIVEAMISIQFTSTHIEKRQKTKDGTLVPYCKGEEVSKLLNIIEPKNLLVGFLFGQIRISLLLAKFLWN